MPVNIPQRTRGCLRSQPRAGDSGRRQYGWAVVNPLIPSVKRRSRLTSGQRRSLQVNGAHLATLAQCAQLDQLFDRSADQILDIGFGDGLATISMAQAEPQRDILAVELYPAGVAQLLGQLVNLGLTNVRVVTADARHVLAAIPEDSLAEVRVFFPDPWPKSRHHKRRLISPSVITTIAERLRPHGLLQIATDWGHYAEQIREILDHEALLTPISDHRGLRPVTRFEHRAREIGRASVDIRARRIPSQH